MIYLKDSGHKDLYEAEIKINEEADCDYNLQILDDEQCGTIFINVVKNNNEYIGTLCNIDYGYNNENIKVNLWNKFDFDGERDHDVVHVFELPEFPKKKEYTLEVTTRMCYTAEIRAANRDEAFNIMKDMYYDDDKRLEKYYWNDEGPKFTLHSEDDEEW